MIRLIESKQCKMSSSLGQVFICLRPRIPYPLPFTHCSVYVYTVYLFRQGKGGGRVELERRLEGQQFTKLGRKYQQDRLYLQSTNSDKHLPQSHFTGQYFQMTNFCFGVYIVSQSMNQSNQDTTSSLFSGDEKGFSCRIRGSRVTRDILTSSCYVYAVLYSAVYCRVGTETNVLPYWPEGHRPLNLCFKLAAEPKAPPGMCRIFRQTLQCRRVL